MKRLIVGASGASGMPVLRACLQLLREQRLSAGTEAFETTLILTDAAKEVLRYEDGEEGAAEIISMADAVCLPEDIWAGPASGSYETAGMLIVPCSMKTLAGIHSGYAENLLLRAADVTLKEKRPLVLGVREMPLSPVHLRNMYELSMIPNVWIMPLMMSFYQKPQTLDDMVRQTALRLLMPFGFKSDEYRRWKDPEMPQS